MKNIFLLIALLTTQTALAGEVTVTDSTGREITFTAPVERIVVMHEPLLGLPLMDLGITPVASYGRADDGTSLTTVDFVTTVLGDETPSPETGIGPFGNIDLEKLRSLKPDLIIGTEHDASKVAQLATVAPLYLQNVSTGRVEGFGVERDLAELLGLQDSLAKRLALYQETVGSVKAKLGHPEDETYLAIILTDQLNLVGAMSGMVQAVEDLGYTRAEVSNLGATSGYGKTIFVPISPEIFARVNPDLLVIMRSFTETERDEAAIRKQLDRIVPGWDKFLKPAREDRVVFLDSAKVSTPTIASALNTLNALSIWAAR
ncbi:ABC transporter substrate-binding protein [Roseibium sp.]|uniref:ABC transporter substrate-binding protein n=1 Tax=Roseibium sp. TaxID=1936156 RepID=UPI003A985FB6